MKAIVVSDCTPLAELPAVEKELVALNQAFNTVFTARRRCNGVHRTTRVIGYVERLLDVQFARFAVAVDTVPIEQPIRCVTGLLDLGDQEAGAKCVNGAGFDQDAIAYARLELVEARFA